MMYFPFQLMVKSKERQASSHIFFTSRVFHIFTYFETKLFFFSRKTTLEGKEIVKSIEHLQKIQFFPCRYFSTCECLPLNDQIEPNQSRILINTRNFCQNGREHNCIWKEISCVQELRRQNHGSSKGWRGSSEHIIRNIFRQASMNL